MRRNDEDARSLLMICVGAVYLGLLLSFSRPSFGVGSIPDDFALMLAAVLLLPPFLVAWCCSPGQRDAWASYVWRRVARPAQQIEANRWVRRTSAAVTGWMLPSGLLVLNAVSAAADPGELWGWRGVAPDRVSWTDRGVVLVAYPIINAFLILVSVCVLGAVVAGYRHSCLTLLFDRRTGWRAWLRTIAPIAPLRLPPLVWRTFAGGLILALLADLAGAAGSAVLETFAIGAIVLAVYVWSLRVNVHEFKADVLYGPTTYLATAIMVWVFDTVPLQGDASISVFDWVDLVIGCAVALVATAVSVVRVCAAGSCSRRGNRTAKRRADSPATDGPRCCVGVVVATTLRRTGALRAEASIHHATVSGGRQQSGQQSFLVDDAAVLVEHDCNPRSHGVGGARRSSTGSSTPASTAAASASR